MLQALGECIAAALVLKEGLEPEQVQPKAFGRDTAGKNPNPMARTQIGSDFFVLGKNMIRSGRGKCS